MDKPLPPPHPSLPRPPVAAQSFQPSTSYAAYHAYHNYSSHYAQAYYSQMPPQPAPVPGYNISGLSKNSGKGTPVHAMSTWYHAGNVRCSYPGCPFQGSQKSVEIHRMDRHLVYPPDWDKRKKKSEWDADPSLKDKPIPIQGTNVTLDSPEVIDAWIAERKKRFPTSARVVEKKRKLAEAVERGQLDLNPSRFSRPPKRPKIDGHDGQGSQMRGSNMRRGKFRNRRRQRKGQPSAPEANITLTPPAEKLDQESDDGDDDVVPEELSSKMPDFTKSFHDDETVSTAPSIPPQPQAKRRLKEPRGPPQNPFASRPALLRNLLLPEIRMTVSNLSQAIRFLVDNDFLRNVELKPGQAAEQQKIHVLNNDLTGSCDDL